MPRRPRRAILGGTFDRLHAGHLALLDAAFGAAPEVRIGLTSERYLARHPKPLGERVRSFEARRRDLARTVARRYPERRLAIVPIDDRLGGALQRGIDVLVLSEETASGGRAVNRARVRSGLTPLKLVVIPRLLSEDLGPIEGRRIRAGEIDANGRHLGRLRIEIGADAPQLRADLHRLARRIWPGRPVRELSRRAALGAPAPDVVRITGADRGRRGDLVRLWSRAAPMVEHAWDRSCDPPEFGGLARFLPAPTTRPVARRADRRRRDPVNNH